MLQLGDTELGYEDYDRTVAIIISNGKIYESDINHQCCLEDMQKDVFASKGWNIGTDEGLEKAIGYTNEAFRNNELYGFDIMQNLLTGESYLIAHYPQNLENREVYNLIKQYAEENDLVLATYLSNEKLGWKFRVVLDLREEKEVILC